MKSTFETIDGQIIGYDIAKGEITIKAKYSDWDSFFASEYNNCKIQLVNGKPLSSKQRKACYALLRDIADWSGMKLAETKRVMKDKFLEDDEYGIDVDDFSLRDAPMRLVSAFQEFLIDFILANDVPTQANIKDSVNADRYMYMCCKNRRCCVCGQQASLFTNGDGLTVPVCGAHRIELLTDGPSFYDKYHLEPVEFHENNEFADLYPQDNIVFEGD